MYQTFCWQSLHVVKNYWENGFLLWKAISPYKGILIWCCVYFIVFWTKVRTFFVLAMWQMDFLRDVLFKSICLKASDIFLLKLIFIGTRFFMKLILPHQMRNSIGIGALYLHSATWWTCPIKNENNKNMAAMGWKPVSCKSEKFLK